MIALLSLLPALLVIPAWLRWNWVGAALVSIGAAFMWIAAAFALFIARDFALPIFVPLSCLALAATLMGGFRALVEERKRRAVLALWGRYQDPRLVEYLVEHPKARGGQGREAEVTVLFADLKGFTKTVQHLEPEDALRVLNRYLSLMTDVIRDEYGAVIDKYLGDGLMAQWGAPRVWSGSKSGDEHHAATAIRACLELMQRADALTRAAQSGQTNDEVTFELRLTLHTGPVVDGWVGAERIEYTIIGDNVNVCARLQETAKELGCDFLISETTYELAKPLALNIGKTSEVSIRGRDHTLGVYEVQGVLPTGETIT
jgi:adenylate cyclase